MMRRRCAVLLTLLLSLTLAGCFTSKQAKFPLAGAEPALAEGGRYRMFDRVEGGTFVAGETVEIRRRPDGAYDFVDPQSGTTTFSLHRIDGALHVAQAAKGRNAEGYDYLLVRIAGGEILTYPADCKRQNQATLAALGVEARAETCSIDGVKDPAALFAKIEPGEPSGKLVRE
jgi:hypothetical protein